MQETIPTNLRLDTDGSLIIDWSDAQVRRYPVRKLRDSCPCATCREKTRAAATKPLGLPILKSEELQPLKIENMRPVGSYAYNISFSDGHHSGIYSLELLLQLGSDVKQNPSEN
jgi:DUF971 family protein